MDTSTGVTARKYKCWDNDISMVSSSWNFTSTKTGKGDFCKWLFWVILRSFVSHSTQRQKCCTVYNFSYWGTRASNCDLIDLDGILYSVARQTLLCHGYAIGRSSTTYINIVTIFTTCMLYLMNRYLIVFREFVVVFTPHNAHISFLQLRVQQVWAKSCHYLQFLPVMSPSIKTKCRDCESNWEVKRTLRPDVRVRADQSVALEPYGLLQSLVGCYRGDNRL